MVVEQEFPARHRRLTRQALWELYFQLGVLKSWLNIRRCQESHVKWEREWVQYVLWSWEHRSESSDWSSHCLAYSGTLPYCRLGYILVRVGKGCGIEFVDMLLLRRVVLLDSRCMQRC